MKVHADMEWEWRRGGISGCRVWVGHSDGVEGVAAEETDYRTMGWSLYVMHTASLLAIAA